MNSEGGGGVLLGMVPSLILKCVRSKQIIYMQLLVLITLCYILCDSIGLLKIYFIRAYGLQW